MPTDLPTCPTGARQGGRTNKAASIGIAMTFYIFSTFSFFDIFLFFLAYHPIVMTTAKPTSARPACVDRPQTKALWTQILVAASMPATLPAHLAAWTVVATNTRILIGVFVASSACSGLCQHKNQDSTSISTNIVTSKHK